jgi:hypothetical protein
LELQNAEYGGLPLNKDIARALMILGVLIALGLSAGGFLLGMQIKHIGSATQNAKSRAEEFAKNGGIKVGVMHSASQGAFYILQAGASMEGGDYSGAYDKTTIEKLARVVVTIEYNIDR